MAPIELWPQGIKALWIQTTGWQASLLRVCVRWRVWVTPHVHRQDDGAHTGILIEIACCLLSSRFGPSLNYSVSAGLQKVFAEWEQNQKSESSRRLRMTEEMSSGSDFNPDFSRVGTGLMVFSTLHISVGQMLKHVESGSISKPNLVSLV